MPIYRIAKRGVQERKERQFHAWVQAGALLISGLLLSVAAALLLHARAVMR
jgi:hypothetical protein